VPGRRPDQASARGQTLRAKIVFYAFFVIALFIIAKFYIVQVRDGPSLAERGYEQRLTTVTFPAHRGAIFDRDGATLVRSLPSQSIYATPRDVQDQRATARALASVLPGVSEAGVLDTLQSKHPYVQVVHKISHDEADAVAKLGLSGISIVPEQTGMRFVTAGRLASSVIGFTGADEQGSAGAEYSFDSVLRGSPGQMQLEGDVFGRAIPFAQPKVVVAAKPGHSIALTIDSYLQFKTQDVLDRTVAKWHAQSGSAIVLDPNTGEVLALANAPDYDAADYWNFSPQAWRDGAVMDAYEPGSTFKLITAAAALDSGKVTPNDRFPARDELEVGGRTIHNAEDGFTAGVSGTETLGDIIAYSHNVGAAEVGLRIGSRTMYEMMRRFGFGDATEIGLPGENPGIVPKLADWSETSLPTMAFGHGVAVTPLALARAYAAIANGGILLRPRILAAIVDSDGHEEYRYGREVERRVMSERTAAILRGFLRGVVVRGTGNPTAQIPGYTTAGKTGTAQVAENGGYSAGDYVASFVGYVPAESPRFVILVKIAKPRGAIYGSVVAAPAFAELAKNAMMHAGVMPAGPRLVRLDISSNTSANMSAKHKL